MKKVLKMSVITATALLLCLADASAQSRTRPSESAAGRKAVKRLPRYFTHLNFKVDQLEEVAQIQSRYKAEISALANQLAELKEAQQNKLEKVLTRTQKSLLNKYKSGALKVSKKTAASKSKIAAKKRSKGVTTDRRKRLERDPCGLQVLSAVLPVPGRRVFTGTPEWRCFPFDSCASGRSRFQPIKRL